MITCDDVRNKEREITKLLKEVTAGYEIVSPNDFCNVVCDDRPHLIKTLDADSYPEGVYDKVTGTRFNGPRIALCGERIHIDYSLRPEEAVLIFQNKLCTYFSNMDFCRVVIPPQVTVRWLVTPESAHWDVTLYTIAFAGATHKYTV